VRQHQGHEEAPPHAVGDRRARRLQARLALVLGHIGGREGGVVEDVLGRREEDGQLKEGEEDDGGDEGGGQDDVVDGHVRLRRHEGRRR